MKRITLMCIVCLCMLIPNAVSGRKVKGVTYPETASIDETTCTLNGVGLRKKVIISVYLGGLYLEKPSKDAEEIITSEQVKQVVLNFLYKEVRGDQMVDAWNEGFEKNAPDKVSGLKNEIDRFNGYFTEPIKKGETMVFTYRPGKGTEVAIKDTTMGTIEGKEFMEALFSIWFGPKPPGKGLKNGMMGK